MGDRIPDDGSILRHSPESVFPQTSRAFRRERRQTRLISSFEFGKSIGFSLFCMVLVALQTLVFVARYQVGGYHPLFFCSLLPGFLLGLVLHAFERLIFTAGDILKAQLGGIIAGFLLFFVYLIGYILIFSFMFSFPLGWVIGRFLGTVELARKFGMFSTNFIILVAIVSWLAGLRTRRVLKMAG